MAACGSRTATKRSQSGPKRGRRAIAQKRIYQIISSSSSENRPRIDWIIRKTKNKQKTPSGDLGSKQCRPLFSPLLPFSEANWAGRKKKANSFLFKEKLKHNNKKKYYSAPVRSSSSRGILVCASVSCNNHGLASRTCIFRLVQRCHRNDNKKPFNLISFIFPFYS